MGATGSVSGADRLRIDRVPAPSRSAVGWLQATADVIGGARERLEAAGIVRGGAIEPLGEGADSFRIRSPASTDHRRPRRAW